MENMDRRHLFAAFSALGAMGAAAPARAQTTDDLSASHLFKFEDLPPRTSASGVTQRRVLAGTLPTGEFLEVHETMLPAGQASHRTHRHANTEMQFVQTGTLECTDNGKVTIAGPGAVVFTASNVPHTTKNIGATPATYIVVSVGKQTTPENL